MTVPEHLHCQVDRSILQCNEEADFVLRFSPPSCGCMVDPDDSYDFKTVRRLCMKCFRLTCFHRLQNMAWSCVHCGEVYCWSDLLISVERL